MKSICRINGHQHMMWEPYCCLSKVCLEVVFTFSCHFSKVNHFQELRQQSYSFYLWNSEPNISSPLNTQAAQLWSNQEGITYIFSFLLYKWVPSSSFYFFSLKCVWKKLPLFPAEYRKMVEKLYKPPTAA